MTWGECKLIALQTMFSNEGVDINVDDSNQDYVNAMPGKANEAMMQLSMVGRPILKSFRIVIADGTAEAVTEDQLTLPAAEVRYKLDMKTYCPRWRCLEAGEVYLDSGGIYDKAEDWAMEGTTLLALPGDITGTYTIWYDAYPQTVTKLTEDSETLDIPEEAAVLIPVYIAAELYKEDELALATMLRNEFEDGLNKLRQAWQETVGYGFRSGAVRNTTGWW